MKFPKEIKLKRYLHEMTDVVIAGTKVDGAGEERSLSEQEAAVVKQGTCTCTVMYMYMYGQHRVVECCVHMYMCIIYMYAVHIHSCMF